MSEAQAKARGYRPAQGRACGGYTHPPAFALKSKRSKNMLVPRTLAPILTARLAATMLPPAIRPLDGVFTAV